MPDAEAPGQEQIRGRVLTTAARLSAGRFASPRVVFVGFLLGLVIMVCRIRMVDQWLSLHRVSVALAVTAAAIGVFSTICCAVIGQLHDDARGLGFAVIAVAHTVRVASGLPVDPLGISFSCLRFLGVSLIFFGAAPAARRALVDAYRDRVDQLAELTGARSGLPEMAQRDHEVRNSLNVLASATALLNSDVRDLEDETLLRSVVDDELARLNVLLRPRGDRLQDIQPQDYDLLPILRQRVALAASTGMDIRLADVERSLRAQGNPLVVTQVLANILTNCARHAPGSPVRISASRRGRTVILRVCDFGPGVPTDLGAKVFECGVRGPKSSGQGFGLYLSKRLLAAESGQMTVRSRQAEGTGCTVVIELPVGGASRVSRSVHRTPCEAATGRREQELTPPRSFGTLFSRVRENAVRV